MGVLRSVIAPESGGGVRESGQASLTAPMTPKQTPERGLGRTVWTGPGGDSEHLVPFPNLQGTRAKPWCLS